jgi:tetratricopeptide (TPR) repeat protein
MTVEVQAETAFRRALALHRQAHLDAAGKLYEQVLDLQPLHANALHLLGVIALETGHAERAAELIGRAVRVDPQSYAAHLNLGTAQQLLDRPQAAIASFNAALRLKPDLAAGYFNRGNAERSLGHLHAAVASYDAAIALAPDYVDAHLNRGLALTGLERYEDAIAAYGRALAVQPDCADGYFGRANALRMLERPEEALADYDRAISQRSGFADAHVNRAAVRRRLGRLEDALADYDRAIAIKSDYVEAYSNRGAVLAELNRIEAAIAAYDRALALKADHAPARFNRGIARLLRGEYAGGWADYEWRWRDESGEVIKEARHFSVPRWQGDESLAGRTILLFAEQGLGDTLQFCRYAPLLAHGGAKTILEVQPPLVSLLASLPGVAQVLPRGGALPAFDYWCPLMSLPSVFKTTVDTIPRSEKYLRADSADVARWRARLPASRGPYVGLVWSGRAAHKNDHNRSLPFAKLLEHLPAGYRYVSLQKDVRDADRSVLRDASTVVDIAEDLRDFRDTAAVCECMDGVISVDTSVAHLSAALGKRTYVLLPIHPDWRWLLERGDSPWYPTASLYRQERRGDWSGALETLSADLTADLGARPPVRS